MRWLIYGATGYTGTLVAEEAVKRGHKPILAGRSREKLAPLAERLNLDYAAFSLDDADAITKAIADADLVYHAAGPFIHTAEPMRRACLNAGKHYLDITGEIQVFEDTFLADAAARERGIALISGAGFDVIPTDCTALYVAQKFIAQYGETAHTLDIALMGLSGISAGTTKTAVESGGGGGFVRRDGVYMPYLLGVGAKRIPFPTGHFTAMPIPWGDLATAYHTTEIPNITTYMAVPRFMPAIARFGAPIGQFLLRSGMVRTLASKVIERVMKGPDADLRATARSYVYVCAADQTGTRFVEAWLDTVEPYRFTAEAGVLAVEHLEKHAAGGALTPAQAVGADFPLAVPTTVRLDHLD